MCFCARRSCTFKAPVYDPWDAAPACPKGWQATVAKDTLGRQWGWAHNASCAINVSAQCHCTSGPGGVSKACLSAAGKRSLLTTAPLPADTAHMCLRPSRGRVFESSSPSCHLVHACLAQTPLCPLQDPVSTKTTSQRTLLAGATVSASAATIDLYLKQTASVHCPTWFSHHR